MIKQFRLNYAYIFVLSILLQSFVSYCHLEFTKDTPSNAEDNSYVIEEQRGKLDPSIEQIFRAPNERRNDIADSKRDTDRAETGKTSARAEDIGKRVRVKRDSAIKRTNSKSLNEPAKSEAKRSTSKDGKASARIGRASKDLPKLPDKDYEIPVDQDRSEYLEETEDDSAGKGTKYKAGELRVGEDSERFIDQEERSSLYDDFEAKDVVKRGITGAEDYEEVDEEAIGGAEDAAALEEDAFDEETDKKKIHGDVRVKREPENSKEPENAAASEKAESPTASGSAAGDQKVAETSSKRDAAPDRDGKTVEGRGNKVDKNCNDQTDQSKKRNVPEKSDESKLDSDRETNDAKRSVAANDRTETENGENANLQAGEGQRAAETRRTREDGSPSNDKVASEPTGDSSSLERASKIDESKVAEAPNVETTKLDVPANGAEATAAEDSAKLDGSKAEARTGEQQQLDADYEKRVEEQIQRKIDSIKEEIKREIAENQRVKEIEENNAKFDELREQEEDEEDQAVAEAERSDKRNAFAKRSVSSRFPKSQVRDGTEKRLVRRKKRQGDGGEQEKGQGPVESNSGNRKSCPTVVATKKRSVSQVAPIPSEMPRKREYPRQVYLVRSDRKRKRKRRSKNSVVGPEQRNVKLEDSASYGDAAVDSSVRVDANDGKLGSSKVTEDERAIAEQNLSSKKSGSVASLTGNEEQMGPLATEYREAFGGLNAEPGVALARFKRIKRVLRPSTKKT